MSKNDEKVNDDAKEKFVTSRQITSMIETQMGIFFRYNVLEKRIEFKNTKSHKVELLTKNNISWIHEVARNISFETQIKVLNKKDVVLDAIFSTAKDRVYDPIQERLKECLTKFTDYKKDYLSLVVSKIEFAVAEQQVFFRKWIFGILARYYKQYQNYTLILTGSQGIGKSTLLTALGGSFRDHYTEESINLMDKDHHLMLCNKLIWVVEEFNTVLKTSNRNAFKAFMTKEYVDYRAPYGTVSEKYQRIASFVGTTNDAEFLTDPTGNRRYLVCEIISIDHKWFREEFDADLFWGQVINQLARGEEETYTLNDDERAMQTEENDSRLHSDYLVELFHEWFEPDAGGFVTTADIYDKIYEVNIGNPFSLRYQISDAMQKIGAKKTKRLDGSPSQKRGYSGISWCPSKKPVRSKEQQEFVKTLNIKTKHD